MIRRAVVLAALPLIFAAICLGGAARACDGQKGKIIFNDDFSDDSGGWESNDYTKFNNGAMNMAIGKGVAGYREKNLTFTALEGDFCVDFILPAPPANAKRNPTSGLIFWMQDYDNYYEIMVTGTNTVLKRVQDGNGYNAAFATTTDVLKKGPGDLNEMRVVAAAGLITAYLNGQKVAATRVPMPTAALAFGLHGLESGDATKDPMTEDTNFAFKNFAVTSGN